MVVSASRVLLSAAVWNRNPEARFWVTVGSVNVTQEPEGTEALAPFSVPLLPVPARRGSARAGCSSKSSTPLSDSPRNPLGGRPVDSEVALSDNCLTE
jgi:hypothetical protein